jgi:hypothetical protein
VLPGNKKMGLPAHPAGLGQHFIVIYQEENTIRIGVMFPNEIGIQ